MMVFLSTGWTRRCASALVCLLLIMSILPAKAFADDAEAANGGGAAGSTTTVSEAAAEDLHVSFDAPQAGQSAEAAAGEAGSQTTGDRKTGEDDAVYDQTTVEETPRQLTVTVSEVTVSEGDGEIEVGGGVELGMESIEPTWPGEDGDAPEDMHVWNHTYVPSGDAPEGCEVYYYGYTADSVYGIKYADGEKVKYSDVIQFMLKDPESGEIHTAYCVDASTGTKGGWWYEIENLEDADYYTEEEAQHIRAAALNGYWGTESGLGSLSKMKETLKNALALDPQALGGLTEADIDLLTEGEAQTATQMAIWAYGNREETEITPEASNYNGGAEDGSCDAEPGEATLAAWERINRVGSYLAELRAEPENVVFTSENFISSIGMTVGEKAAGHANNADQDDSNDVYQIKLHFALEVTVDEKDDLIVRIVDPEGNVVRTARLAGDDSETGYGTIYPDESGSYTISGLTMAEGDVTFNLTLEGAQYLEQGVYLYTSEVRENGSSQSFIGIAEGYHAVDLGLDVTMSFQVDEGSITARHEWRRQQNSAPESGRTFRTAAPKTGDESVLLLWACLLGSSLCAAALMLRTRKGQQS